MKNYYVYLHSDMSGNIFYVGKGSDNRAYSKTRNKRWQKKVKELNDQYIVDIPFDNLSEEEAYEIEATLIDSIGIQNLTNSKKESIKEKNLSMDYYKTYQYIKDILWVNKNLHTINTKDKFIKTQLEIIDWADKFRTQLHKELKLLK
jgi:hypothetical protein